MEALLFALATASAPAAVATASVPADAGVLAFLPRNDPGTAALLSVALNGAGQFYNGENAKGWWMLASWGLYPLGWLADTYLQTGYYRVGGLAFALGVKAWSAWDAYDTAQARKEEQ